MICWTKAHLFTDNFYTKVPLAEKLLDRDTFLTGTVNKNSKLLTNTLKNTNLGERESVYFRKGEVLLVSYKQRRTGKSVFVLTTATHAEDKITKSNLEGMKPVVIDRYNQFMGGVDVSDKAIYHNSCNRHTTKYWRKQIFNLLDISLFNAYVLYSQNTDKPMARRDFLINIVDSLCQADEPAPAALPGPAGDGAHRLETLPKKQERLCAVCGHTKKRDQEHGVLAATAVCTRNAFIY